MRGELAEQQKRLEAQVQAHKVEIGHLAERTKELEAALAALAELKTQHANVTEQLRLLTESLATESGRREAAEKQAAELMTRRSELEQELAQRTQAHEQMRSELAGQQKRLDAQMRSHKDELGHLDERTKEFEAARAALAELKTQHANVAAQVRSLTESLAAESGRRATVEKQMTELVARRTALEQELAQSTLAQEQLRNGLAEQVQAHKVELGHLAERTKELEAARAALAELKTQHANVTAQVRSLTESLATESGRRLTVEQQAAELVARRAELEQELARRSQTHAQLRAELDAQVQAHKVELGHLATRTKELEAAQAALAESKAQHVVVTEQLRLLTESLAIESGRRETVETQMAELVAHRAELEQELARRSQTQEQLRSELAEKKQRVEAISADLEGFRSRADAEALRQKEMAGQIAESEQARTELGKQLNAARELSSTREAAIRALEIELQQRRGEHERLDALFQAELAHRRRLETQIESVQSELEEASSHLAQKCAAEQTWLVRESELQGRLRNQQAEIAKSGEALASQEAEIKGAREKIGEMQVLQSALCAKVQDLTGQAQSLTDSAAAESGRRAAAEKQMTELVAGRTELEQELARRAQTQEQLRGELDAKIQTHNVELGNLAARTKELEATHDVLAELKTQHAGVTEQVRSLTESLAGETGRRSAAEKQVSELVAHRTGLEQELAERMQAQTKLRAELAEQVQAREVELGNLAARTNELEATHAALAELKTRHAGVTEQVRLLTESLAVETGRHAAAAQVWTGRESELQSCLRTQQDQLATSGTTLANQEAEIKNARKKIEDLQVFQSALCAKVQALTEQVDLEAKVIEEWKAKAARSESAVENGLKKMAGLRYAILDASRMSARLHRERSQQERQNLDAMRQLLTSLAQTPLSLAQRGMLAELHHSVDGLKNSRPGSTKIPAYPAEPPSLRGSEFSFAEVTGSAFQTVKMAAEAAGVAVQVSASGTATGKLIGCAEHVHQLITLLAVSPLTIMTGVSALDLRVAIKPRGAKFAEMTMRVALLSDNNPQDLLLRLTSVTAAASALQTGSFCEAELGLAAGWQLTQAMGAQAAFEIEGGKEVCLVLSLPIDLDQPLSPVNGATAPAPARNGNGNVNGNGSHSRNGNGYHLTESHAGIEN
jgi:chromosome segregation ATPase